MKQKLLNNIGLKLISVIAAVIIWMVIVNVDDAVMTKTITLPVQEINADDLESVGKTYEVVSGETATFKIKGRTSVIKDLDSSDFKATADLSKLSVTGSVWVDITANDNVKNCEIISNNNVYVVATENLVSKQFAVTVRTRGNVAKGYALGNINVTPNMINISGSETKISNIKEVVVYVQVDGYASNISMTNMKPFVYALNGDEMDIDRLSLDNESVNVSIAMLRTKSVPVKMTFKGKPADDYIAVSKDAAEVNVEIAGAKEDLDKIDALNMVCDIDDARESIEKTILYKDFLPDGITLAEGDLETSGVAVKVVIEPIIEKDITLSSDLIALQNASAKYAYEWDTDPVVTVKGPKSVLEHIEDDAIKLRADVGNYREGNYYVLVNVIGSKDITVPENLYLTIHISSVEETEVSEEDAGAPEAISMIE